MNRILVFIFISTFSIIGIACAQGFGGHLMTKMPNCTGTFSCSKVMNGKSTACQCINPVDNSESDSIYTGIQVNGMAKEEILLNTVVSAQ